MSEALEMARELVRKLEAEEKENKNKKVPLSALFPGETFKIGGRDFIILEHTDNGTKVISKGLFAGFCFAICFIQVIKIADNIFIIHRINTFVFTHLGKVTYFFVSFSDFGLLTTLTVCLIQNGRTPLLLL